MRLKIPSRRIFTPCARSSGLLALSLCSFTRTRRFRLSGASFDLVCCLPEAAREWNGEQLRSVLLHELAHVKRRDTVAQLLAQIACALHWFNPLVWHAAGRLGVERERACDDLVLASGVRPSAYAGHLLEVVTGLSPARRTQSCGLAMARKSGLEGRLIAVLSENKNRHGVSAAVAAIALAIAAGIAVSVAMVSAADDKPAATAAQAPQKPKAGGLELGTEEHLAWGQPVNGLRAAIAIRPAAGEPKQGEERELYLAVQNVSDAPIRSQRHHQGGETPSAGLQTRG